MSRMLFAVVLMLFATTGAHAQSPAWQAPAPGPALTAGDLQKLAGRICWGWFDRGTNSDNSRGAVFVAFEPAGAGRLWRKWGLAARNDPRKDKPEGYDDMGRTGPARLSDSQTEVTFKAENWFFDWFIRPNGDGTYRLRAVGTTDANRGAVGQLTCS